MDVKLGLSSYSLYQAIRDGRMTVVDAVRWAAEQGFEHFEVVPAGFDLRDNPDLTCEIRRTAERCGIALSSYTVGNNFIADSEEEFEARIAELKKHVDIGARLGVKLMRHDVAWLPAPEATIHRFERELPRLVEGCRRVADYAARYGIVTSVENHGFFVQAADRVQRLVRLADRPNFRTTLDVGNFICVDEDPVASVKKNLPYASMIHVKDFYVRPAWMEMGEGWFRSAAGKWLCGAITGYGDLDLRSILKDIKASGYAGFISIEFEGLEDCLEASRLSRDQFLRLWERV
jgi:sugar phosphate isomerase/epimerase